MSETYEIGEFLFTFLLILGLAIVNFFFWIYVYASYQNKKKMENLIDKSCSSDSKEHYFGNNSFPRKTCYYCNEKIETFKERNKI